MRNPTNYIRFRVATLGRMAMAAIAILFVYLETYSYDPRTMANKDVFPRMHDEEDRAIPIENYSNLSENPVKKILVWTEYEDRVIRRPPENFCSIDNCELIKGKEEFQSADAIVFNLHTKSFKTFPAHRYPHQYYVGFFRESPEAMRNMNHFAFAGLYNATMTYRRDSDIVVPFGKVIPLAEPLPDEDYWQIWKDSKLISWRVSKCKTLGRREDFVQHLRKYIPVDVYGGCGEMGEEMCGPRHGNWSQNCQIVYDDYMFYLSFENSICLDYVTEKIYYPLMHFSIPIVFGGADYANVAPPNSYIDALSFPGPMELAQYLKKVASNSTLFNSYHKWRQYYTAMMESTFNRFCDLCAFIHGRTDKMSHPSKPFPHPKGIVGRVNRHYPDLKRWFFDGSGCSSWSIN